MKPTTARILVIALLFIAIFFTWTRERDRPYYGHHDWDMVKWVPAAENFQRYGLIEARFQQIMDPLSVDEQNREINQRHPPAISIFTLIGLELFGNTEFTSRILPLFVSLSALAIMFALAKRLFDHQTALLSVFFFGLTPLMIYFSSKIGHEQYILPLMLLVMYLHLRPLPLHILAPLLFMIGFIGTWVGWYWYFFVAGYFVFIGLYQRQKGLLQLSPLWVGSGVGFLILVAVNVWGQSDYFELMEKAFLERSTGQDADSNLNLRNWILLNGARLLWLATPVVPVFFLVALWQFSSINRRITEIAGLLIVPVLTNIAYCLVFWKAFYIHEFLLYYFWVTICILAAVGFLYVLYRYGRPPSRTWQLAMLLVLGTFLAGSYRWGAELFAHNVNEQRYTWGLEAGEHTDPGEVIVTNIPGNFGPHIAFYARRSMRYSIEEAQVISEDRPASWGFFIHCVEVGAEDPEWLSDYTYSFDEQALCYLVDLNPDT